MSTHIVPPDGRKVSSYAVYRSIDLDESEEEIQDRGGLVGGFVLSNEHTTLRRYVHFYDAAAANVIVGTTVPKLTIGLAALTTLAQAFPVPIIFRSGICIAATTTIAGDDAPGANEVIANVLHA